MIIPPINFSSLIACPYPPQRARVRD